MGEFVKKRETEISSSILETQLKQSKADALMWREK